LSVADGRGEGLRVVIAGGGTGGHTSAGLGIAAGLRARLGDGVRLAWIGSHRGIEASRVPQAGIRYHAIATGKLRRSLALQNLSDVAFQVPWGILQAWRLLGRLRPHVVVTTGGFVAVPTALAAALRRRPLLVHEQVVVPGLANRVIARFARRVAVTFEASATAFPAGAVVVTGNPVRPELTHGDPARALRRFDLAPGLALVYVTGGAQGSHRINRVVGAALEGLLEACQLVHQTGDNEFDDLGWLRQGAEGLPRPLRGRYRTLAYVEEDLGDLYAAASLVVGRAGAGTITELCAVGLPAVLIPLPEARGDEQTRNARVLSDAGAAVLLPERDLSPERLLAVVRGLLGAPDRLASMRARARALATPEAAARLADLILALAEPRV
jgi:UDP-N-acetylglucosamine--N-acetylmuramyl-(pentapeptide) pyrophosphoryl-undecaprenol N-acetylglucosamine transferase